MVKFYLLIIFIPPLIAYAVDNEIDTITARYLNDFYKNNLHRQSMSDETIEFQRRCLNIFYDPSDWVQFMLYTRNGPLFEELFVGDFESIKKSKFDKSKETKIVVHGWLSKGYMRFCRDIRKAYLEAKDCNVIDVEWPSMTLYTIARLSVGSVAAKLSEFLKFLIKDVGVDPQSIHLLGHSLGAHISGIAGSTLGEIKLPRITGFDPAGPLFSSKPEYRIDASDAQFVDIVHTGHWLGYFDPIGHVDFYPNGAETSQPGCGYDVIGYCTHCRSYLLYVESITSSKPVFLAAKCGNYSDFQAGKCCSNIIEMGENVDRQARGTYFLFTGDTVPYGLGKQSIPEQCSKS